MYVIAYSQAADYIVLNALKSAGISGYTKIKDVCGEGIETEPKLGTHTWPGENNVILVAVTDERERKRLLEIITALKRDHPRAGVKGFVLPLEEVI